jgi:small conductance mechanosensitive channel
MNDRPMIYACVPRQAAAHVIVALAGFLAFILIGVILLSGPAFPQEAEPESADFAPPTELVDPGISTAELAHRLIPLTKDELDPVAQAWLGIVKSKTAGISERQIALLNDPSKATDEAYAALAKLVEDRAALFERFSSVVNALESKGGDEALVAELRAYRDSVLFNETMLASPKAIAIAFMSWLTRTDGGLAVAMDIGIVILAFFAFSMIALATVTFWVVEGWSLLDAAFFSVVTISTVGYGNLVPETALGKIFAMFYILVGLGVFVAAASAVAEALLRRRDEDHQNKR